MWNRLRQITYTSPPLDHIYVHVLQTYTAFVPGCKISYSLCRRPKHLELLLLDCFMTLHPLELPLVGTAGTIRQRLFCKLSAKPCTSSEAMVVLPAAPGRHWRDLPWSRIAFSKGSMAWQGGDSHSDVPYTRKGVSQMTDLPVHLHYSQTAISAGKYFRQRVHVS